jgi:hypothetical protein
MRRPLRASALACLTVVATATACLDSTGPSGRRVRAELRRTPVAATGGASLLTASNALEIESFRVPIKSINLVTSLPVGSASGNGRNTPVYTCSGTTNDECLLEFGGTSLADLLDGRAFTAPADTFRSVWIETCATPGSGGYTAYLRGSVVLGGTRYYTKAAGGISATGPSEAVPIRYQGCGRTTALPTPVSFVAPADTTLARDTSLTFRMFFDIRDIAWGASGTREDGQAWLPGGCSPSVRPNFEGNAGTPFVCTGYPDLIGTVDTRAIAVERYRLNGGATLGLFFTGGDAPLGGYTRRFYEPGVPRTDSFSADVPVRSLRINPDGTVAVQTFGVDGSADSPARFRADAFARATHSGTFTTGGGAPQAYSAVRLP